MAVGSGWWAPSLICHPTSPPIDLIAMDGARRREPTEPTFGSANQGGWFVARGVGSPPTLSLSAALLPAWAARRCILLIGSPCTPSTKARLQFSDQFESLCSKPPTTKTRKQQRPGRCTPPAPRDWTGRSGGTWTGCPFLIPTVFSHHGVRRFLLRRQLIVFGLEQ